MNTEFIIGGIFFFVIIIAFVAGMFFLPEFFGISRGEKTEEPKSDDERK